MSVQHMKRRGFARSGYVTTRLQHAGVPIEQALSRYRTRPLNAPWAPARAVHVAELLASAQQTTRNKRGILLLKVAAGLCELTPAGKLYVASLQAKLTEIHMQSRRGGI